MRFFLAVIVSIAAALPAAAQPWYARGSFNGYDTSAQMVDQGGGHYTATISGLFASTDFEYKLANNDFSVAYPSSNGKVTSNASGEINFHLWDNTTPDGWFPNNTRRAGYDDHQQFDWEIIGNFTGGAFDVTMPLTDQGNGLHTGTFNTFAPGFYEFKFRKQGDWATSIGHDFGNQAGNNSFRVWTNGDPWSFELDLPNGRWRANTNAPNPDPNNDNKVDARDYVLGRNNNWTQAEYDVWRANYGFALPWYARGSFNNFDTSLQMVDQGGGHFTATVTGLTAGTDYEYKIAHSDFSGAVPGSNGKVRADASGEINFHFYELDAPSWNDGWNPANASRVGYEDHDLYNWEIVGAFNGWPNTNDSNYSLTDQGSGLHTGTFTFATAGTYEYKFRHITSDQTLDPAWNTSIGDNFGNAAANNSFTVANANDMWTFELDLPNGRWRAIGPVVAASAAVPEPGTLVLVMFGVMLSVGFARRR